MKKLGPFAFLMLLPALFGMQRPKIETYGPVEFVANNDTTERQGVPHVRGVGKIPLDFEISDTGSKIGRKLKVYVDVYELVDAKQIKHGNFVKDYIDPKTITSQQAGEVTTSFKADIPVKKGDYVFYVYLCDPDRKFRDRGQVNPKINKDKIPGAPRKMQACVAHVD